MLMSKLVLPNRLSLAIMVLVVIVWSTYQILSSRIGSNYPGLLQCDSDEHVATVSEMYPKADCCPSDHTLPSFAHLPHNDIIHTYKVSPKGSDVIVFVRIQKTGSSTFAVHMADDLDPSPWCRCDGKAKDRCSCYKKWKSNILFKRRLRDKPCRSHADWTHLHACVEDAINKRHGRKIKQRHLYVTMLRQPVKRYISEWKHVARGAIWNIPLLCNGRSPTKEELIPCFEVNWKNVSLHEFMDCQSSLAINRQTRMLANLSIVDCYNTSASGWTYEERQYRMLASAKENLQNLAYFGLTEYQELSQILFENTFNLKFTTDFKTFPFNYTSNEYNLTDSDRNKIFYMNRFDVLLYDYAKDIFFQRLKYLALGKKQSKLRRMLNDLN